MFQSLGGLVKKVGLPGLPISVWWCLVVGESSHCPIKRRREKNSHCYLQKADAIVRPKKQKEVRERAIRCSGARPYYCCQKEGGWDAIVCSVPREIDQPGYPWQNIGAKTSLLRGKIASLSNSINSITST